MLYLKLENFGSTLAVMGGQADLVWELRDTNQSSEYNTSIFLSYSPLKLVVQIRYDNIHPLTIVRKIAGKNGKTNHSRTTAMIA